MIQSLLRVRMRPSASCACLSVGISSTVPRVVFNLRVFADRFFGCRPLVVGKPDCLLPVLPRVDAGTAVGPDRLVNAAGAYDRHGGNKIVVDFGTATTFDVVDDDGAVFAAQLFGTENLTHSRWAGPRLDF